MVSECGAGGLYRNVDGCDSVMRYATLTDEELRMDIFVLVVFEMAVVKNEELLTC